MMKDYVSKLPFLHPSKSRRKEQQPVREAAPPETEDLWPEGDPFAPDPEKTPEPVVPAEDPLAAGRDAYRAGDYETALAAFLRAAEQGHIEAQFLCGQMYRRGIGTQANDRSALIWYKRAAKQGHLNGQLACASIYEDGRGTEIDLKRSLSWYELAARQGSVEAQLKCGYMYYGGRAETRNPRKARHWLETAAENGSEEAEKFLKERF